MSETMSEADRDRMERAAERVELANELCRQATIKLDRMKARLRYIAIAKPSRGEPAWHFIDRIQAVASQADGEAK
jgi:hypothetical protein